MTEDNPQGWLTQEDYEKIYRKVPMFCVDMLIKVDGGIILSKRNIEPFKGFWHFPGGRVRYKESIADAIQRIAMGEIGIETRSLNPTLLGIVESINDGEFRHSNSIVYLLQPKNAVNLYPGNSEATELKVFSEVPQDMQPYQQYFLQTHAKEIFEGHR